VTKGLTQRKIMDLPTMEVWAIDEYGRNDRVRMMMHGKEAVSPVAQFAFDMIERWGMVVGKPSGEDSQGRAKMDLMPVDELVDRAFAAAHLAWKKAREYDLIATMPTFQEIQDALRVEGKEE
jgi:hypothetical protein